jgi:hypothetical protein
MGDGGGGEKWYIALDKHLQGFRCLLAPLRPKQRRVQIRQRENRFLFWSCGKSSEVVVYRVLVWTVILLSVARKDIGLCTVYTRTVLEQCAVSYSTVQGARGIAARFLKWSPASTVSPIMTKFSQYTPHSSCYLVLVSICRQD